jgi:DNA polymerase-3 subunit epsilon
VAEAKQCATDTDSLQEVDSEILLQTLLQELKDGVIVCNHEAKIVIFNQAAADLFDQDNKLLSKGTSLFRLCHQAPVKHALDLLHYQMQEIKNNSKHNPSLQFINEATNQKKFFSCRMSILPSKVAHKHFIVIIFEDVSTWYRPDNLLFKKIDEFRAPMTNLRAAVESLTEHPEMSPVMRSAFENVLVQESLTLSETFDSLDHACNLFMQSQSHLTEIKSDILFGFIANHFRSSEIRFTAPKYFSVDLKVDSYGLILVLDHLADKIQRKRKPAELLCEIHTGKRFVYFDFIWQGEFIPTAVVQTMLEDKILNSVGELSMAVILHSMGGDIWSKKHDKAKSTLRLALPLAKKV